MTHPTRREGVFIGEKTIYWTERIAAIERDNLLVCDMASKVADERDRLRQALKRIAADTDWPGRMAREALKGTKE